MPAVLRNASDLTPYGAAAQATQGALRGCLTPAWSLLLLGRYAAIFGCLAARLFCRE